jgi:hypothetical protein
MKIETRLQQEIANELEELSKMQLGSDEYRGTVDGLTKLMDRAIEIERLDIEMQDKVEARQDENDFRSKQLDDEHKDRFAKNAIAVFGILIPTAVTIWGTIKSIEFEKEGTITTIMGRGFINKLLPKK